MQIKLSKQELYLLKQATKGTVKENLSLLKSINDQYSIIELSDEDSTELREICSDYLSKIGFDENYQATPDGMILENLIDKLFVK